ncbi:MAG: PPOX class F420-dependent oxidoreductase [Nitrosopumilaceae archaeon]|nr:PPOX class F420-dependent oxidoreductase [Nitrosopumilaceae archaeon]NIU00341.1 PPOX class F420-dependent oxidoreductase [Nitrosopumilaceae archaeon]NIU86743.1 PPOX class F420-dependent oxidoreductase [Nitrosopumilaceae archaeon]NIV65443.1 PPOX class F420-dependent oxidoreductase [Nitrosopumilaceae archaeon]NIX60943.1 PPOX class F420-dependent oxidoreductase [Nitrosopumilaceae archaeon]
MANIEQFQDKKYINLETFKKDGTGVKTPVWLILENNTIYIVTRSQTGKVKRIRNNSEVRVVPCSLKGDAEGEWQKGKARLVEGKEAERIIKLRSKKYGFMAKVAGLFSSVKGDLVVFAITLD